MSEDEEDILVTIKLARIALAEDAAFHHAQSHTYKVAVVLSLLAVVAGLVDTIASLFGQPWGLLFLAPWPFLLGAATFLEVRAARRDKHHDCVDLAQLLTR